MPILRLPRWPLWAFLADVSGSQMIRLRSPLVPQSPPRMIWLVCQLMRGSLRTSPSSTLMISAPRRSHLTSVYTVSMTARTTVLTSWRRIWFQPLPVLARLDPRLSTFTAIRSGSCLAFHRILVGCSIFV
uniref:Uncharacterized protein n=1 Tax=uncultured marine virus TaxID=186617 RepID=A0A0F7L975_9VIRU|nr:hypothetical protein [uncultured marine virus]